MVGRAMDLSARALAQDIAAYRRRAFDALALGVSQMVMCRTLPPDDAYWWARVLAHDAHRLDLVASPRNSPPC
jgi:hypothetical protein